MKPSGFEIIRACPHCKFPIRQTKVEKVENLEGIFWTDGKEQLPLFPMNPRLIKCQNCNKFYWKKDAQIIGECDPASSDPGKRPDAWEHVWVRDVFPDLENHNKALQQNFYSTDAEECYIRTMIWWQINDRIRSAKKKFIEKAHQKLFIHNLYRLRDMYVKMEKKVFSVVNQGKKLAFKPDPNADRNVQPYLFVEHKQVIEDFRLHVAEISRELGDFDSALKFLDFPFTIANREVDELHKLIEEKDPWVHRYTFSLDTSTENISQFAAGESFKKQREHVEQKRRKAWKNFVNMFR